MLRTTLLALACTITVPDISAAQVASAPAQSLPFLKSEATVTGDLVRIGDLVENAGVVADVPIFRAPDLGQSGSLPTARIVDAIRPHKLSFIDTRGVTQVDVIRASRSISVKALEERIAEALAERREFGDSKDLAITFDRDVRPLHLEPSAIGDLKVVRSYFDRASGHFDVSFDIPRGSAGQRLRLTGTATEMATVAIPGRALARGDVIKSADIVIERRQKAAVGADAFNRVDQVVGFAARRPLNPGQPLRANDIMKPQAVRQNEMVTIFYEVPGIGLSALGKAIDSGAEGDVVNVLNLQSKRTVQGTVTGPGRVTIAGLLPRTAEVHTDTQTTASISAERAPQRAE
jgi:flagella basal body P-ring formation protein FlgA